MSVCEVIAERRNSRRSPDCLSWTSSCVMEVSAEAKRIMVVALGKLYSSRSQRGGLRLHRSLLLTLVMKSARDMYHAAQATVESVASGHEQPQLPAAEANAESDGTSGLQGAVFLHSTQPGTSEEGVISSTELRRDAHTEEGPCQTGPALQTRKRRGKAAAEPDFLPCKKAKLELGSANQELAVSPVFTDFVMCSTELGAPPTSIPLPRAIAAC
ncbi:immediate early response gene 2 protein [Parambassis ranga]|uniref:Immediate early response gene 2 protein n=1 Tax=Parambassis ranga TaxID=210632 RepID=A0A6P7ITX2_9TELE|nr:immediate early response gene 2 protein-like [Parambassis ranga]